MTNPFDMRQFANQLLAGMAARHAPPPDDERPEWQQDQQAQAEYQQYLDDTDHERE